MKTAVKLLVDGRIRRPNLTKQEIERMQALDARGWSLKMIAKECGVDRKTVARWVLGRKSE
jgi:IS30 family transposase